MKTFYHFLVVLLIPLFLAYSSSSVYAEEKITPYTPEEIGTEPVEIIKPKKEGGVSWFWIILGIAAIGGGVAAAAGGGSSTTTTNPPPPTSTTGTYTVTW
ncbi:MAG TPA: hypothetical protein DCY98_01520 [Nitrospinae bacterium]|nr:hypothetical protein [Nitrospinota bacterium]